MADVKTRVYTIPYKEIKLNRNSLNFNDCVVFWNGQYHKISDFEIATSVKKIKNVVIADETRKITSVSDFYANKDKLCVNGVSPKQILNGVEGLLDLNFRVLYDGKYIPVQDFSIATKTTQVDGVDQVKEYRPIKSIEDLNKNINKLCYDQDIIIQPIKTDGVFVEEHIERFVSRSINTKDEKVEEGLRRELAVVEATKSLKSNYLCVEVNGNRDFIKKNEIYWLDGEERKNYNDLPADADKSNITFFDEDENIISAIYTEKEYLFDHIVAKENYDLNNFTKQEFSISKNNKYSQTTIKLNRTLSRQIFSSAQVQVANKPHKTKIENIVKTTNFQYAKDGEYVALNINGKMHITAIKDLETEDGVKVEDISKMVGKRVKIKENNVLLGLSDIITLEQSKMTYNSIKTYQPITADMSANTCLRLSDGSYINELKTVQPISYKLAADDKNFDAYLVERVVDDKTIYEVVQKEFYEKNKKSKMFAGLNVAKIDRCDINDKRCVVVQRTSKGNVAEQADIVRGFSIPVKKEDGTIEEKQVDKEIEKQNAYQAFLKDYKTGEYKISDVYINGEKHELDRNTGRFEYTDVSTRIVNKKFAETSKYYVGNEIKNSFKKFGSFLGYSLGFAIISAGLPVVGPIVGSIYVGGVMAAIPGIPLYHGIVGTIKNVFMSKEQKAKANQAEFLKHQSKEASKELKALFELVKQNKLTNEDQFEDAFASHVMDRILALSKTERIDSKGKKINNQSGDFENLLNSAASLKLFAYVKNFKDSEFSKTHLSYILAHSDQIGYDLSKGLTINGVSILAKDSKIQKALKNDPEKIKEWYQIKDKLIESIELMKTSNVKEPVEVKVEEKITESSIEEELYKSKIQEIEKITSKIDELSNKIETNQRTSDFLVDYLLEYGSLKETYNGLCESVNSKVLSSELEEVIAKMNDCLESFNETALAQEEYNEMLDKIEQEYGLFTEKTTKIESKLTSIKENKDSYVGEIETLKEQAKKDMDCSQTATFVHDLQEVHKNLTKINERSHDIEEKLDDQIISSDKNLLLSKMEEYYQEAQNIIEKLKSLPSSQSMSAYTKNILHDKSTISNLIQQAKLDSSKTKDVVLLKEKVQITVKLMIIGVKSLEILEVNKHNKSNRYDLANIGNLLGVYGLSQYIRVAEEMDNKALRQNLAKANDLFENQISAYAIEEKNNVKSEDVDAKADEKADTKSENKDADNDKIEKPVEEDKKPKQSDKKTSDKDKKSDKAKTKKPKLFDVKINSEDSLVELLKANPNKKERKKLIAYISEKSGVEISEVDIKLVIDRINEKHLLNPPRSATNNASRLANKNIYYILEYGQQYLTKYAKAIKERIINNEDNNFGI